MTPDASYKLEAAHVITPDDRHSPGWLTIEGGRIADVGEGDGPEGPAAERLEGLTLAPGFVDVHVHGGGGYSLTTDDPAEIAAFAAWAPSTGVTSFLASVVAGDLEQGIRFTRAIAEAGQPAGANLLGVNLEGPFLNPERSGAIPKPWIVPPDADVFNRLRGAAEGKLRLMTVAPEIDGAESLIEPAVSQGVTVSVGHTDATYEEARGAFRLGAAHVTHAFNAMRQFHHREPGPLGAALTSDNVTVEVIADGVHLHPATVRWLVGAFGAGRVALVTDGTPLAGAGGGSFRLGSTTAEVREGRATLADGTIAGSVATMDEMVRNVVSWGICDLAGGVLMASTVPARTAGVTKSKGRLAAGYDADLVAIDEDLRVVRTWIAGRPAFNVKTR